jgi:hypothetical protein
MTEKTSKTKKAKKAKKADHPSVLASLPATRPSRIGAERGTKRRPVTAGSGRPASRRAAATRASAPTPPDRRAKPAAGTAKSAASKPKPAARTPKQSARTPEPVTSGPQAVRAGSPRLESASERSAPPQPSSSGPPSGGELVSTAIQAAGELAQIGLTVGGQIIRRAIDRLPKP